MDSRSQLGVAELNPMLLQHTLRGLCSNDSQWVYAVFWRILPRNYPPPQWDTEGDVVDRSKGNRRNWILVWEDGFCNFAACSGTANDSRGLSSSFFPGRQQYHYCSNDDQQFEAMNPELFFRMSHDVYNYGEGLMGKVAADKSHKWVYQVPLENEMGFFSPWHGNIDPHPRSWEGQFKSGIKTITVIAVEEGVLQLGSTEKIMEDLNFVLYMHRKFNFLHSIPGVFVPHPTSSGGAIKRGHEQPSSGSVSAIANNQSNVTRPKDQFLFPGVAPDTWHPIVTRIAGKKRSKRPDPESSESLNSNQYPFLNVGHGFDQCTQQGSQSPSKILHTGLHSSPHTLMPSMSSLQALLSKLPSVTVPLDNNNGCSYPSNENFEITNSGGLNDLKMNKLPAMSSDGSDLQRMVEGGCTVTSPINCSSVGNCVGEDIEFEPQNFRNTGAKEKYKYNSMFDSFDNFTEFGIQEALENGDSSYSSFLNEICG